MPYVRSITLDLSYAETVTRTQEALAEQGFGVLTEIDVQATLKEKLGQNMEPYVILGACNPELAHRALEIDREIGALLPCNVVVREQDGGSTVLILDPQIMASLPGRDELQPVADEATRRMDAVLATLGQR
ncbi:MAG: DUF302 domain-containing protein [Sporichthyaceae bacterium]|nr:DUF302 domain-containing protein [Sporichthyaceae bacterium]